ncbi:hypothetical protein LIER_07750 [Lithospermum erythrorhizon]|uniref:Uncharacterized protein n=1 Tax=Lithospermum erythrorhizon TaxID=34254 RepID=A0AAV3P9F7_LITER
MASSPSGGLSPSPAYSSSVVPTLGRTPSPEYTPVAIDHYIYRHRWIALCGRLRGKRVAQLRDMKYEIFEQLEADLEDDPESSVMCAALGLFFRWVDLTDTLSDEARMRRSPYLILLEDARSKVVSQSLRNRELLPHANSHFIDSVASRLLLERNQETLSELAVIAHRVEF